jgi:hypothetical protein
VPLRPGRRWVPRLKWTLRVLVLTLVTWGIWKTVEQARHEFAAQRFDLEDVHVGYLVAAGVLYVAGFVPSWVFWHRTLWAMGQRPRWGESLPAFWIGHLGKYVPGKAMVVVLRTGLIFSERVNRTVAATSVFVETLTLMAVGAGVSALALLLTTSHPALFWLAVALMIGAGLPTLPPVFRQLVKLLQVQRANPEIHRAIAGVDLRLMAFGWLIVGVGWVLLGVSLWATLRAIPGAEAGWDEPWPAIPLLTATVGLAMEAGFLTLIPGGLGVRDWVLMALLAPAYGTRVALVSAVLLRIIWLLSELVVSAILYVNLLRTRRRAPTGG